MHRSNLEPKWLTPRGIRGAEERSTGEICWGTAALPKGCCLALDLFFPMFCMSFFPTRQTALWRSQMKLNGIDAVIRAGQRKRNTRRKRVSPPRFSFIVSILCIATTKIMWFSKTTAVDRSTPLLSLPAKKPNNPVALPKKGKLSLRPNTVTSCNYRTR